jgi:hypothetical protein
MTLLARYAPGPQWHRLNYMTAGIVWALSSTWILLKDASWLSAIGLICLGTVVVSRVASRVGRNQ